MTLSLFTMMFLGTSNKAKPFDVSATIVLQMYVCSFLKAEDLLRSYNVTH